MQQTQIKTLMVNIMTAAVLVGVVVVGYFVFVKNEVPVVTSTVSTAKVAQETASIGKEIESTIRSLKKLNGAVENSKVILELPSFNNLQDYSVMIPSEPISRENPFIPTAWKIKMKVLEDSIAKAASSQSNSAATVPAQPQAPATPTGLFGSFDNAGV